MNRSEAIRKLHGAGKREEVDKLIADYASRAQARYKAIDADTRLTEDARRYDKARAFVELEKDLNAELERQANRAVTLDRDDASTVFGTAGLPGDAASLTISMRDAADRVSRVQESKELLELLEQATRTGDEVLARAVVRRGVEIGNPDVVNTFTAARPSLEAATERLWNERHNSGASTMNTSIGIWGMTPSGFSGSIEDIRHLARQGQP